MIHILFNRSAGTATLDWITGHGADAWRQVCQTYRDMHYADTDVLVSDERDMPCLTVKSAHACARNQDRRDRKMARLKQRKIAA